MSATEITLTALMLLLTYNGTITTTQLFILLALLSTTTLSLGCLSGNQRQTTTVTS